jgi:hypothetical protein
MVSYLTIANRKYSVDLWEFNNVSVDHTVRSQELPVHYTCTIIVTHSSVPIHNSKSSISLEDSVPKMPSVDCEDLSITAHEGTSSDSSTTQACTLVLVQTSLCNTKQSSAVSAQHYDSGVTS